jgi:DNA-binding beta-propeller fold protein YncE
VTVIDPSANRVQQTIPASGSGPVGPGGPGLAFAGGTLWVANAGQRQVARIEPDADPAGIPVRASPSAMVAAQDAVWVAGQATDGGGRLARIDSLTNQVDPTIPLRHVPTGLAVTPDGQTVWVVAVGDQAVRRVDTDPGGAPRVRRISSHWLPTRWHTGTGPSG